MQLGVVIVRVLQIIFSVIVLALSITAVRWQVYGKAPAASGYNSFAGAWSLLFALIGLAAAFVTSIPGLIMAAIDALTFIILIAGGIAYAVQSRGVQCSNTDQSGDSGSDSNPLLYSLMNGGTTPAGDGYLVGIPYTIDGDTLYYNYSVVKNHCSTIIADDVFIFLAALTALTAAILVLHNHRRGHGRHSAV